MTTRVTYPGRTANETRQLVLTRRGVIVVSPWVPAAIGGLLALIVVAWWWRRRRQSNKRPASALDPATG